MIIYLFTAIGLSSGGSGYFKCKQNMKLVTTKFKSGGLHEKHVVATIHRIVGFHSLYTQRRALKVSRGIAPLFSRTIDTRWE